MKKIAIIIFLLSIISCQNNSKKEFEELNKINWLLGEWKTETSTGSLIETWTKENDSTFSGKSIFLFNKDTLHNETIELYQDDEILVYASMTKGVNSNDTISFKMTSDKENEFVFENPKNDYPKKITYKSTSNNSLLLTISGKQQGKDSKESFILKK